MTCRVARASRVDTVSSSSCIYKGPLHFWLAPIRAWFRSFEFSPIHIFPFSVSVSQRCISLASSFFLSRSWIGLRSVILVLYSISFNYRYRLHFHFDRHEIVDLGVWSVFCYFESVWLLRTCGRPKIVLYLCWIRMDSLVFWFPRSLLNVISNCDLNRIMWNLYDCWETIGGEIKTKLRSMIFWFACSCLNFYSFYSGLRNDHFMCCFAAYCG